MHCVGDNSVDITSFTTYLMEDDVALAVLHFIQVLGKAIQFLQGCVPQEG
jgi:hypothetical protein